MTVRIELAIEDLADTRFGVSPLAETVRSLRAVSDPGEQAIHLPWVRGVRGQLEPNDGELLHALIGPPRKPSDFAGSPQSRAIPDFLTPCPTKFIDRFEDELETARNTPLDIARMAFLAAHAPDPVPEPLRPVTRAADRPVRALLNAICDALQRYWERAMAPTWPQMRLVLEADMTYRARQLAVGGARLLFADIHPNVHWHDGALSISEMISDHTVFAAGRGLLLMPSIFAPKPVPPIDPDEPPSLAYPTRGLGTLWALPPVPEPTALIDLLGRTRALLLQMLDEPLPTIEIARRLKVTPSAVSQHLQVLHRTGLVTRARDRRQVLYRRSPIGDELTAQPTYL